MHFFIEVKEVMKKLKLYPKPLINQGSEERLEKTIHEIKKAIVYFKNNKAAEDDDIVIEAIKLVF